MSFSIENNTVDVQAVNQAFFDLLDRGMDKQAAESGNRLIRTVVRQEANVRSLFNVVPVGAGDLDQHPTSDQPMKYLDIEPNSEASTVQFYATPEAESYTLSRVPGFFQLVQSKEFYKSKFELMTNRNDVRQILADYLAPVIAAALGYSEAAAFIRAYKRWFGKPPGQDRR